MKTTDAHVHFWRMDQDFAIGLNRRIARLERDFVPSDLKPVSAAVGVERVVVIQAAADTEETFELLRLACDDPFIAAVVGWVDILDENLDVTLDRLACHPKFSGVRLMAADYQDPDWLTRADVLRGASELSKRDLTADLLVRPSQLSAAITMLEKLPRIRANINHCGRPLVVAQEWQPWADLMAALARFPDVTCKYSGLIERGGLEWTVPQFQRYISHLVNHFGPERLLFGSNWPVIELIGTYKRWWQAALDAVDVIGLGEEDKQAIFAENANRFYCRSRDTSC